MTRGEKIKLGIYLSLHIYLWALFFLLFFPSGFVISFIVYIPAFFIGNALGATFLDFTFYCVCFLQTVLMSAGVAFFRKRIRYGRDVLNRQQLSGRCIEQAEKAPNHPKKN